MKTKILSIITILTLILNLIPFSVVNATSGIKITMEADKTNVEPGNTINYTVKLNTTETVSAIQFNLEIPSGLTYVASSGKISSQLKTLRTEDILNETGLFNDISFTESGRLFIFLPSEPYDMSGITELMTFSCTVNNDASGNYNIGLSDLVLADENDNDVAEDPTIVNIEEATAVVDATVATTGINITKDSITLENGKSEKLSATVEPNEATDKTVTWTSGDNSIATVSTDGTVTAKKKGSTTITAQASGGQTDTCQVTVTQPVTGVTVNKPTLNLNKGGTEKLIATVEPSNADGDKTVVWSSDDDNIATVAQDGTVTAVSKGSTNIIATVGKYSAKCVVTVGVPLNGISLNETQKELNRGDHLQLSVTYDPNDTDADKTVSWASSNESVAEVNTSGYVTAKGDGDATITATVAGKQATCNIKVIVKIDSIDIKDSTSFKVGESEKLSVTFVPGDTTMDRTIQWKSEDESIATVSTDGTVKGIGVGSTTITAKSINGCTDTCTVTVLPVPLDSISVEQNIELNKGAKKQLEITFVPDNTTDPRDATWSSDDDNIASISSTGLITANGPGKATITVTVGAKTTTTTVDVKVPLTGISLNETTLNLIKEEQANLSTILTPSDTTDTPTIVWSSSNSSVAEVDNSGKVTAKGGGTAYITAKVDGKDIKATCEVNVRVPLTGVSFDKTGVTEPTKLIKNQTMNLGSKVKLDPEDTTDNVVLSYVSSDESVATVTSDGVVKGIKDGNARITLTATINNTRSATSYTATWDVDVDEIPISGIVINKTDFDLNKGKEEKLTATVLPEDTTDDKTVTWSSSDPTIATVSTDGTVKGIAEGVATIKAKAGNKEATVDVNVKIVPLKSISLNGTNKQVELGKDLDPQIRPNPEDTTDEFTVRYTSSDTSVIDVINGRLRAVGVGRAVITAVAGPNIVDQMEIEVVEPAEPEKDESTLDEKTETAKKSNAKSPKTGDLGTSMWIALLIVSAMGIIFIIKTNKEK